MLPHRAVRDNTFLRGFLMNRAYSPHGQMGSFIMTCHCRPLLNRMLPEIDRLVYGLYGLTGDKIRIVGLRR
jgi:hypothetical protein